MSALLILVAAFFLPLFPMSLAFNALAARITNTYVQVALFVAWPQIGVALILWGDIAPFAGVLVVWATLSAILYAFRLLTIRDVGRWAALLASSTWPLVWLFALQLPAETDVIGFALAMTAAPLLMLLVRDALVRRLETAYTGLHGGLARDLPRLSGMIVVATLCAMALPLFPGFFALLTLLGGATPGAALGVLLTWLLWSWAGARLLQGTVFGPRSGAIAEDLPATSVWAFAGLVALLVVSGLLWTGGVP
ncbi:MULTISPECIES: hypothetical protein [unclassified Thioalkalivibrio]|uniref:hypothetical protein n=1 Tax=unclassified Thioalkalivibrio TaxID=2621013 RepID=UPI00036B61E1|nr:MULTISPECIES: hypothetical protein [unclassified Thioalkalivibrio]